jgi:hypothetical protein
VRLLPGVDPLAQAPLSDLGPDALNEPMPLHAFGALLRGRAVPVKALLLDQTIISGIGNWVADEALYQAAVHPESRCCALDVDAIRRLHAAIGTVVTTAAAVEADSDRFPARWLFHYRWVKKAAGAEDALGRAISFATVGGRTSAFVADVQGAAGHKTAATDDLASLHVPGAEGAGAVEAAGGGVGSKRPRSRSGGGGGVGVRGKRGRGGASTDAGASGAGSSGTTRRAGGRGKGATS